MPEQRADSRGLSTKVKKKKRKGVKQQAQGKPSAPAAPAAAQKQQAGAALGEVNELFGQLVGKGKQPKRPEGQQRRSTPEQQHQSHQAKARKAGKPAAAARRLPGSKDDLFGTEQGKKRRRTAEGLALYSEEEFQAEFRAGQGGDTELCPFDCKCCFS